MTIVLAALVTGGILVLHRFQNNPEQVVPFPYTFAQKAAAVPLEAPILIVGDRMGEYFAKFKDQLAATISTNLEKAIKIQSIAQSGHGLHRTLHELSSLEQWPQILIYQGGSEEFAEVKFNPAEISNINKNFQRYNDDRIETFLILYPWLSRIVYEPIKQTILPSEPLADELTEKSYLKRLETELLLYEQQLIQMVARARDRNSLLILTTTPINLDMPPKKVCSFTTNTDIEAEILTLNDLLKANNPKSAYTRSSKLITLYTGNAELLYLHGQIAKRLGKIDEAKTSLLESSAYECTSWRVTEVQNSIIRKVAKEHQVLLFDFAGLLEQEYGQNITFFDEIHPQNLYYDKAMTQLGLVIKKILKL